MSARWDKLDAIAIGAASTLLCYLASRYDFFCDDAFITLRYAENLATHGAPVYNLGERVEGYTSFMWLLLASLGALLPVPLPGFVQGLGAASGVLLLAASWALLGRVLPGERLFNALVLLALAVSAPVAAWTMGGLETALFAALCTWAFVLAIDVQREPSARRGALLGLLLALATLTRPEGALVAAIVWLVLAAWLARSKSGRSALLAIASVATLIVGAHLAWRWSYYGYPLPNTFYLKSSGDSGVMRAKGLSYLGLAARELGAVLIGSIVLGLTFGSRGAASRDESASAARSVLAWIGRLLIPIYIAYVVSVGGDFLDLYRFFVPVLPIGLVLGAVALSRLGGGTPVGVTTLTFTIAGVLLLVHGSAQHTLAERAKQVKEPERAERGIEPQGWTRLYALRWAAMGRWIAEHANKDDRMAVGAAGAMPFYAGIYNLDTFGLCDAWIAHHGPIVSNRPGHQRFAPRSYILKHKPTFLLIGNDYTRDTPAELKRDRSWDAQGYTWAEAKVEAHRHRAPATYYHYFLMRRDRALERSSSPYLRF
jgi:arabinofuranosyltransferase